MYTVKDIPEEHGTLEEKVRYIVPLVNKDHKKLTVKHTSSTTRKYEMGCKLNVCKLLGKMEGLSWQKFSVDNFPDISTRTIQRAMKLTTINLNDHPALATAGETRLLSLIKMAKKKPVTTLLRQNRIAIKFDPKNMKDVRRLKNQIDQLLSPTKQSGKGSFKTAKDKLTMVQKGIRSYIEVVEGFKNDEPKLDTLSPGQLVHVLSEINELAKQIEGIRSKLISKSKRKKRVLSEL